jgi:hypothetical protein
LPTTYTTRGCGNLYTTICERSYTLMSGASQFGMIVPVSCVATERMQPLRNLWDALALHAHASHYSGDAHPSVLFQGVKFRLTILLQSKGEFRSYSTRFQRWLPEGRPSLFPLIEYAAVNPAWIRRGLLPKVTNHTHERLLARLCAQRGVIGGAALPLSDYAVFAHRIVAHFVKALDFIPYFESERDGTKKSEDYKVFAVRSPNLRDSLTALLNSSLFYSWFVAYSDVYHCGREIILDFPCDLISLATALGSKLAAIKDRLMTSLQENSVRRAIPYKATGIVRYDEFYPRLSKPIIDEIDRVLAEHYGFTEEELDFIINYDIKYRMGAENGEGESGDEGA